MQKLQASIEIPSDLIIISKVEYEELLSREVKGRYISLKTLADHLDCSQQYLKENILYNPIYQDELKGFIYYPKSQGEKWKIGQKAMFDWLEKKSIDIFKNERK